MGDLGNWERVANPLARRYGEDLLHAMLSSWWTTWRSMRSSRDPIMEALSLAASGNRGIAARR